MIEKYERNMSMLLITLRLVATNFCRSTANQIQQLNCNQNPSLSTPNDPSERSNLAYKIKRSDIQYIKYSPTNQPTSRAASTYVNTFSSSIICSLPEDSTWPFTGAKIGSGIAIVYEEEEIEKEKGGGGSKRIFVCF